MKKLIGFLLIVLLASQLHASPTQQTFQYPKSTVDMQLVQVSPHVYFVQGATGIATDNQGFISNASAIIGTTGITLVDTLGSPSLAEQFLAEIRKISELPIQRVILTHYHADHIYGLQVFEDMGAKIIAPKGVHEYLESQGAQERIEERRFSLSPWVDENTRLVQPDQLIEQKTTLKQDDLELDLSYLGKSHSDADLAVFVKPDNVFITGDVIFEGRIPFVGDSDTKAWLHTLDQLSQAKNLHALIPGHGGLAKEPQKAITLTRNYLAFLREKLSTGVEEMMDFAELYDSIDWTPFADLPAFDAANRVNAYQVFLSLEKELFK